MNNNEAEKKNSSDLKENDNFGFILACIMLCGFTIPIILLIGGSSTIKIVILATMVIIFLFTLLFLSVKKNLPSLKNTALLLTIMFLAPLFTYIICIFLQTPTSDFVGTVDAWIGFAGSLFGGIITLYVLWMTIEDQNKKREEDNERHEQERKEELAIQYRPFISNAKVFPEAHQTPLNCISLSECEISENVHNYYDKFYDDCDFYIELTNIGRGALCNLTFKDILVSKNDIFKNIKSSETFIGTIPPNDPKYINLSFNERLTNSNLYNSGNEIDLALYFTGTDEFNYKHYSIKITLTFSKHYIDINQTLSEVKCEVSNTEMIPIQ